MLRRISDLPDVRGPRAVAKIVRTSPLVGIGDSNIWGAERYLEFSSRIQACNSREEIISGLLEEISLFGYDRFVYGLAIDDRPNFSPYIKLTNVSGGWPEFYLENGLYESDYPLEHCRVETRPLRWVVLDEWVDTGNIEAKYAKTWRLAQEWGLTAGVTIPLPPQGRYLGGVSLIAPADADKFSQDLVYQKYEQEILTILKTFHTSVNKAIVAREYYGLTVREVDVLQLVSEGLLTKNIADKFETSPHTVEKQIKSARTRLSARTTAEAVTKAALLGLIA